MKMFKVVAVLALMTWASSATSFEVTTIANVTSIDEWDIGFTKVVINKNTSCGNNYFWMLRTMNNYDLYMARVLAALISGRQIRVAERTPAYCDGVHLYNPRIGVM